MAIIVNVLAAVVVVAGMVLFCAGMARGAHIFVWLPGMALVVLGGLVLGGVLPGYWLGLAVAIVGTALVVAMYNSGMYTFLGLESTNQSAEN